MTTRRSFSGRGLWLALVLAGACASSSSLQPKPLTAPTAAPPPAVNPFAGARFYVDPEFAKMVARAPTSSAEEAALLKKVASYPTAVWLESLETAKLAAPTLDDALKQERAGGGPIVPVFVVYNLPNRDCAAEGSRGELFVDKGGEALYQSQFIDVIAAAFAAHPSQKIAVVLEPDSLPNLVTNLEVPTCAVAEQIYRRGIAYAISKLSMDPRLRAQRVELRPGEGAQGAEERA
jgi:cellulose 1,4-beta-cellobiosidase